MHDVAQVNSAACPNRSRQSSETNGSFAEERAASDVLPVGTIVCNGLRVVRPLGCGGIARVYEVCDEMSGSRFALKVALSKGNRSVLAEAELMRNARSPVMGMLYDVGRDSGGHPFLLRDFVEGAPLNGMLKQPMPICAVYSIAVRIGTVLSLIHELGILHRDVKPRNIVVPVHEGDQQLHRARLVDFGSAAWMTDRLATGERCATPGFIFGTSTYMPPEILQGRAATVASDVYGLGITLYRMMYACVPMDEERIERITREAQIPRAFVGPFVLRKIMEDVILPPAPSGGEDLKTLVAAMVGRKPSARPTLDEVVQRCRGALGTQFT